MTMASRRRLPQRCARRGFTLIESLIGLAVMGIAVLGLAQAFLVGVANNKRAGDIGNATLLAQQRIDYLRTLTAAERPPAASRPTKCWTSTPTAIPTSVA
jgi:prepilin-type N-terminal cleavage/methylation domain-containing protein